MTMTVTDIKEKIASNERMLASAGDAYLNGALRETIKRYQQQLKATLATEAAERRIAKDAEVQFDSGRDYERATA